MGEMEGVNLVYLVFINVLITVTVVGFNCCLKVLKTNENVFVRKYRSIINFC